MRRLNNKKLQIEPQSTVRVLNKAKAQGLASNAVWRNDNLSVVKSIKCYVPIKLLFIIYTIEKKMASGDEFGIYINGTYANGVLLIGEDFCVPRQQVTAGSIDFNEDDRGEYNSVLHRHPSSCKSFSDTDKESINQNYEFSLLYVDGEINSGIINFPLPGGVYRVQLPLEIEMVFEESELVTDGMIDRISKSVIVVNGGRKLGNHLPVCATAQFNAIDQGICGLVDDIPPDEYESENDIRRLLQSEGMEDLLQFQ